MVLGRLLKLGPACASTPKGTCTYSARACTVYGVCKLAVGVGHHQAQFYVQRKNFGRITYVRNTETENQQESKPSSCCILNFCSLQTTRAPEASQHEACTVL